MGIGLRICTTNAARTEISQESLNERKKFQSLKSMFDDFDGIKRNDLSIPEKLHHESSS
jgi:hypothetical protein